MDSESLLQRLRGPKVLGMSIFDWVTSLLAAYLVGRYLFGIKGVNSWGLFIIGWILFGVIAHKLACVDTMLGYYLGLNGPPKR